MSNLPNWPGADVTYERAAKILDALAKKGHVRVERIGRRVECTPSDDMNTLIAAMNKGDEETLKGLVLHYGLPQN